MLTTSAKGEIACRQFDTEALRRGYITSIPVMDVGYDRILDTGDRLYKIQIKYGDGKPTNNTSGSITVKFQRVRRNGRFNYMRDEVDAIVAYLPQVDKFVWLDADDFHDKVSVMIRVKPALNCQTKNCIFLEDKIW